MQIILLPIAHTAYPVLLLFRHTLYFTPFSNIFTVDFKQVNVTWDFDWEITSQVTFTVLYIFVKIKGYFDWGKSSHVTFSPGFFFFFFCLLWLYQNTEKHIILKFLNFISPWHCCFIQKIIYHLKGKWPRFSLQKFCRSSFFVITIVKFSNRPAHNLINFSQ